MRSRTRLQLHQEEERLQAQVIHLSRNIVDFIIDSNNFAVVVVVVVVYTTVLYSAFSC